MSVGVLDQAGNIALSDHAAVFKTLLQSLRNPSP